MVDWFLKTRHRVNCLKRGRKRDRMAKIVLRSAKMKNRTSKIFLIALISMIIPGSVLAQDDRKANAASSLYLISARAGAVNFVSGDVVLQQKTGRKFRLQKGDEVEAGEKVSTGVYGKAEVLLNPGSYVRLSGGSEFEFVSTSLDDLQLRINKGSAIFEVVADKDFTVTIRTSESRFYLISAGVFRVDVSESGGGTISVFKGKAQVGDIRATVVKSGKSASVENGQVAVTKFNRKNTDDLDNWSKDRAKEIAKINERLVRRQMRNSLFNSFNNNGWNASSGYGLWVLDPFSGSYCFLPFGWGWRSPYGFGYNQSIWSYNPPQQMVYTINQNQNLSNSGQNNIGAPPSTVSSPAGGFPVNRPPSPVNPPSSREGAPEPPRVRSIIDRKTVDN